MMCKKIGLVNLEKLSQGTLAVEKDLKEIESRLVVLKGGVLRQTLSPEFIVKELDALLQIVRR